MTPFFLLKAICAYLNQLVDDYAAAQGSTKEFVKPRIFEWYLPFKNGRAEESVSFPYIAPRITDGEDADDSTVNVMLYFGVYSEGPNVNGFTQPDGAYDLLNLMEHVRTSLQTQKILEEQFELQKPYKWEIPDEQPYPLWVGSASTKWIVAAPLQRLEVDFLHGNT